MVVIAYGYAPIDYHTIVPSPIPMPSTMVVWHVPSMGMHSYHEIMASDHVIKTHDFMSLNT